MTNTKREISNIANYNKIALVKNESCITAQEYKLRCLTGSYIEDSGDYEVLKVWGAEDLELAMATLKNYRCSYTKRNKHVEIEEYMLEFYTVDEDGEFLSGSDFEYAESLDEELKRLLDKRRENTTCLPALVGITRFDLLTFHHLDDDGITYKALAVASEGKSENGEQDLYQLEFAPDENGLYDLEEATDYEIVGAVSVYDGELYFDL